MKLLRGAAAVAVGVLLVLTITQFGATFMRIEGLSMESSLEPGATVLVVRPFTLKSLNWFRGGGWRTNYRVGSVVALRDPLAAGANAKPLTELLVKRVVAVGPATAALVDGVLLVNGKVQNEPWLSRDLHGATSLADRPVSAGELFVLGDNRLPLASRDSRSFGPVEQGSVRGLVVVEIRWPWTRLAGWRSPLVRLT